MNKQGRMQELSLEGPCVNLMTDKKGIQKDCYNVPNLPKALITIPFLMRNNVLNHRKFKLCGNNIFLEISREHVPPPPPLTPPVTTFDQKSYIQKV